jgi:hypothetical protein
MAEDGYEVANHTKARMESAAGFPFMNSFKSSAVRSLSHCCWSVRIQGSVLQPSNKARQNNNISSYIQKSQLVCPRLTETINTKIDILLKLALALEM